MFEVTNLLQELLFQRLNSARFVKDDFRRKVLLRRLMRRDPVQDLQHWGQVVTILTGRLFVLGNKIGRTGRAGRKLLMQAK